jgi:hypothetical protein
MNDADPPGRILIREHAMSNRLVDGQLHEVPGKKVRDQAACASAQDKEEAQQGMITFDSQFQLTNILSCTCPTLDLILNHTVHSIR